MKNLEIRLTGYGPVIGATVLGLFLCAAGLRAAEVDLSPSVLQQIQSLQTEKEARTPAQLKLDSHLVYAIKMQRGEPVAPGIPTQRLYFNWDANGKVLVDITAQVTSALLAQIRQDGEIVVTVREYESIRARVPLSRLETLASMPEVRWIKPASISKTHLGRLTSEGDATHRAGQARTNFSVMGEGVKVGVLSDSVDARRSLQNSIASGELPQVTVLPGQGGFGQDEGTAMLEIIADLAPKAELFFATAENGEANFAQNIINLRNQGCDVIVDDVGYATEGMFQDSIIAQAVNAVTASGALYFSAAANSGNKSDGTSCTWEGDFADGGASTVGNGRVHTFGGTTRNRINLDPFVFNGFAVFWWSDPLNRSTNDYDLFILDTAGANVVASSTNPQTGTQDPYESASGFDGNQIVLVKARGNSRFFNVQLFGGNGTLAISTEGNTHGHNCAADGFGVAAVNAGPIAPNSFSSLNMVETFSSDGLRRMFYDAQGVAFTPSNLLATGGMVRQKPDLAAADGVTTSVSPRGGPFNPFFGTSAAAPHAAAIAALVKSYNRGLTSDQIRFALTNTAIDIEATGTDRDSGAGICMPGSALTSLPPPLPTLIASNLYGGNGNGVIDPDECNELDLVLRNNAVTTATAVSATLVTTTPGVTVVVGTSAYASIPPGGTAVNLIPFRLFTPSTFVCGTPVDLSLRISSSLGGFTNNFRLATGVIGGPPATVTSTTVTTIPDNDTNGVDILLPVTGFVGSIGKVTLAVHILHEADVDLTLQLFSPDGTQVQLARRRGGSDVNYGQSCMVPTIFDSMAATNIVSGFAPFAGTYRPQQSLTAFNGKSGAGVVNGNWRLHVIDDLRSLTGSVQCATITISPAFCTPGGGDCSADVGVTMTDAPDPVLVGSNLTYTLTITNRSPHIAPVTTLIDTLPPGVTVVSLASSRGTCSASAGSVNCLLGSMGGNSGATVIINVIPSVAGLITNRATVSSIAADTNPADNTAIAVTTVQNPMPIIVPYATSLVSESGPFNGGVDPGETLTINFYLRNIGTLDATNLVAQLLSTGGVIGPSAHQTYGRLVAGGAAAFQPFTFTATGSNGSVITASFQLEEGTNNLGTVAFNFALGGAVTLANQGVIGIPDSGAANRYPSAIPVSGLAGVVSKVAVTFSNVNHSFSQDIDALLVSPTGQKVMLMSDAGAGYRMVNTLLKFDDAGPLLPQGQIVSGTFRPTDYEPGDTMPAPAPSGPYAGALAAFNGFDPNGAWSLYVADDFSGDPGSIGGGWSVSITTFDPVNPQAELAISVSDSPDPVKLGSNVTYTVTVTNAGPEVALGVVVTNTLPAGMSFVSAGGAGVCSNNSGVVVCDLGILSASNSAVITIVATATGVGSQDFTAYVTGGVAEFNLADNTATATTAIQANADLAISIVATPSPSEVNGSINYTLTITNRGPNTANGVTVTNILPAGVTFVGAGPAPGSQGSCTESGGVVTCFLGTIPSQGQVPVAIFVNTPAGVTTLTDIASVASASPADPNLANNQASLTTTNLNSLFIIVPAMTFLVYESGPTNGGIEAGETVIIDFELRNKGSLPTTSLIGTLLPTGGVTSPSAPRTFGSGVLDPNGAAVGASFTFTAGGVPGDLLVASIQLQDGPYDLGTVSFTFPLGNRVRYTQPGAINIPDFGQASPYPSTINVSGLTGTVSQVTITLSNLSHEYPDDINALVVGPTNQTVTNAQAVMLMSDSGGGYVASGVTLTFDSTAANPLPDSGALTNGTYRPTDYDPTEVLNPPAPARPYAPGLDVFNGSDPNGTWSLFVHDDFYQDAGRITNGWSLEITTVGLIDPAPALLAAGRFTPAGQFEFMLKGQPGGKFLIQRSPDMHSWTTIANTVLAPSNTILFTDPSSPGAGPRFYRAVQMR